MSFDKAPVPHTDQWPEARAFRRLYSGNPMYQARLVMTLFGFRQDLLEWANNEEGVRAVETVIRSLYDRHPEFMQDGIIPDSDFGPTGPYHLDKRLVSCMADIGIQVPDQRQSGEDGQIA
jgi:hypothetical protein